MPNITGFRYASPSTTEFQYNTTNVFYFDGTDLSGVTMRDLKGKSSHGGGPVKGVRWGPFRVVLTSATWIKMEGKPRNPHRGRRGGTDPGDITPTLDGGGFSVTFPCDYAP